MVENLSLFYFSPTGGTKKAAELLCTALSGQVNAVDLGAYREGPLEACDLTVIAMPVYGGRIPAVAADRLRRVNGAGKKAVTLAVYGNRAYEDALLELNETAAQCGFQVIASAALIAQHSVVAELAAGRPDAQDAASIAGFAGRILEKLEEQELAPVAVPGNSPYKNGMSMPVSPVSSGDCVRCGSCAAVCPVDAVALGEAGVETDAAACMLCMACVAACPAKARALPAPMQEMMSGMLSQFIAQRQENEYYL